jgi:predicted XRE-type DNA-binding protein
MGPEVAPQVWRTANNMLAMDLHCHRKAIQSSIAPTALHVTKARASTLMRQRSTFRSQAVSAMIQRLQKRTASASTVRSFLLTM